MLALLHAQPSSSSTVSPVLTPQTNLQVRDRMGTTFETAGVSILFTSLTDIMAFAVGASSVFPAVVGFCAYTATGVAFDFLFQVSPACFGRDVNACACSAHCCR